MSVDDGSLFIKVESFTILPEMGIVMVCKRSLCDYLFLICTLFYLKDII